MSGRVSSQRAIASLASFKYAALFCHRISPADSPVGRGIQQFKGQSKLIKTSPRTHRSFTALLQPVNSLQSPSSVTHRWKFERLHHRTTYRQSPNFHPSTKAALRIARFLCGQLRRTGRSLGSNSPVLRSAHIRAVQIWKSCTGLAAYLRAVSPRIPTSPQQTTTTAIYKHS
jgi:hypothetical protein